jgi:hypothetical protein
MGTRSVLEKYLKISRKSPLKLNTGALFKISLNSLLGYLKAHVERK